MYEVRAAGVKGLGVFATRLISRGTRIFSERALLTVPHDGDGAGAGAILQSLGPLSLLQRGALLGLSRGAPSRDVALLRWGQAAWFRTLAVFSTPSLRLGSKTARLPSSSRDGDAAKEERDDKHKKEEGEGRIAALRLREYVQILAIFRSNAFDIDLDRQAVFPCIARLNHSCVPNAQSHFHEGLGRLNVHATRDIPDGEEVMINYLKETGLAPRRQRQGRLLEGYGFDCECPACDARSASGHEGERRRVEGLSRLAAYAEKVASVGAAHQDVEGELAMVMGMVKLFEQQGLTGRVLASYYLEASKLSAKLGRHDEALVYAEKALQIDGDCLGKDHELYRASLNIVTSLRRES